MPLHDDLDRALRNVGQVHLDHVRALGVTPEAVASLGLRQLPFGVERISVDDAGRWWPDGDGKPALVVPVIEYGEPLDIVAFHSSQPTRWWWRISERDIALKNWATLGDDRERIRQALTLLEECDWLRSVDVPAGPQGGRPTTRYIANPKGLS